MFDTHYVGHIAKRSIKGILANNTDRGEGCCDTSASIVRSGEKDILLGNIVAITYTDIIRQFGCDKYSFAITQCPCGFIQYALATANDSIKEIERFTVLYDLVIFTHHTQYGIVIGADIGKVVGNVQFVIAYLYTVCRFNNARTFCI
ncbi:hypothetical protein D3C72_1585120 [compost metagenome]